MSTTRPNTSLKSHIEVQVAKFDQMCGLSAVVALDRCISLGDIHKMNSIVRHRGPDGEGYIGWDGGQSAPTVYSGDETDPEIAAKLQMRDLKRFVDSRPLAMLAHRRLSVLDVSIAGHQPMVSNCGRYWVTFNGEIYNYRILRRQLEQLGHSFRGNSDTEVLLTGFSEWGETVFHRLRGMFSVVLLDIHQQVLIAVRDTYGIKPLYFYQPSSQSVVFVSEIKQLTALNQWSAHMNGERALDFLMSGLHNQDDDTFFENVQSMNPGSLMRVTWANGRLQMSTSKMPTTENVQFGGSYQEAVSLVKDKLVESVELHLQSDVPLGFCLSGGLDSSTLIGIAHDLMLGKNNGTRLHTFSARSHEPALDEYKWMKLMASHVHAQEHYCFPLFENNEQQLLDIVWTQDQPFGSSSILAQDAVFKEAKSQSIKVILDGQGADEIFGGYHSVFAFRIADLIRKGHVAKAIKEFIDIQCTHPGRISRDIQLLGKLVAPATLSDFLMKAVQARLRSGKIWMNIEGFGVEQFIEPYNKSGFFKAGLQNHLLAQLESTSLPMLLHYEDRNSMRHGVESRVPFVDVELINLVRRLPGVFLVEGAETKKILRSAVKGFIPDAIFQRRDKMGFQAAEERWVKGPGKEFVLDTVHETVTKTSGLFTQSTIKKFDRMVVGDDKYDNSIWRFLTFGAWIERFNVSV